MGMPQFLDQLRFRDHNAEVVYFCTVTRLSCTNKTFGPKCCLKTVYITKCACLCLF